MKTCAKCGRRRAASQFAIDRSRRDGRTSYCKPCRSVWAREYRRRAPDAIRATDLWRRYRLRLDEYRALVRRQRGRCAICRTREPGGRSHGTWHVDHDHRTARVRGLLCSDCNNGIARFKDRPALLRAAATYLENA